MSIRNFGLSILKSLNLLPEEEAVVEPLVAVVAAVSNKGVRVKLSSAPEVPVIGNVPVTVIGFPNSVASLLVIVHVLVSFEFKTPEQSAE